ncbi:MAG: hypothetical protein ABI955_13025, partial [Nitrospirota bacterium]
ACFPSMSIRPLSHLSTPISRGGILTRSLMTGKLTVVGQLEFGYAPACGCHNGFYGSQGQLKAVQF